MINFEILDGHSVWDNLGFLPTFLDPNDPRSAVVQLDANYQHGGGWQAASAFTLDPETMELKYPGDPPLRPVAVAFLRSEQIYVYPYSFVAVVQPDGKFEAARMD